MATASADNLRAFELGDINELPMIADDTIYEGSAVGLSSGYARPLVSGDDFEGFAERKADNEGGSAGDVNVRIRTKGLIYLPVTSVAITDNNKAVYATDDNTFDLTTSGGSKIGTVYRYISSGYCIVKFEKQA